MEYWQKDHITTNLASLVRYTRANPFVLSKLIAEDVLSPIEIWILDAENGMEKMTLKLYEILMTREGSYETFLRVLEEQRQFAAVNLLKAGHPPKTLTKLEETSQNNVEESTSSCGRDLDKVQGRSWQRDHLKENLVILAERTFISAALIARLRKILSDADIDELDTQPGNGAKAFQFYSLLLTKAGVEGDYELLISALQDTMQTGAVAILKSAPDYKIIPEMTN